MESNENWDNYLQRAGEIIQNEELNKRELWKMAWDVKDVFGPQGLKEFAGDLKERFGLTRSYNTLRQYAHVYEIVKDYDIPEDIPFTTIRAILGTKVPLAYLKQIVDGASSAEIMRLVMLENPPRDKVARCKKCGKELACDCQKK